MHFFICYGIGVPITHNQINMKWYSKFEKSHEIFAIDFKGGGEYFVTKNNQMKD